MTIEIRTQREVVDQMVASHRLSFTEADEILNAPRFKILWRELLSYIAVLVIILTRCLSIEAGQPQGRASRVEKRRYPSRFTKI